MANKPSTDITAPEKKEKKSFWRKVKGFFISIPVASRKKVLKLVLLLLVILVVTNPSLIPFLPASVTEPVMGALNNLFGNVSQISSMIRFDWVVLFQLVVMFLMLRIVWIVLASVLDPEKSEPGRSKTVLHLLKSIFRYMIFLVGIFWSLSILGVNLATLFASVGILALVIGFGAESLIADMITGLFMFFENEYNVGDIIEVNGYRGKVTNIGIRTTSITDNGGNVKVVNNSDMRNIVNLSHENSFAICDFPIPHSADLEAAEKALEKVLADVQKQNAAIFTKKPEYVGVQYLDAGKVVLRISAEVNEANRFDAARILNRALKLGMGKFAE